jgi:hypothetical protein
MSLFKQLNIDFLCILVKVAADKINQQSTNLYALEAKT